MTSRSNIPRLGAVCGLLGTLLERDGQTAWDVMHGWEHGPRRAPTTGDRGGGNGDAGREAMKDEARQRQRAAEHFAEYRQLLGELDTLAATLLAKIDIAVPPNAEAIQGRRRMAVEPWTPAEIELAGWCSSCARVPNTLVLIYRDPKGMARWRGSCSWCGPIRAQYHTDPPLELLEKHLAGRNLAPGELEAAMERARASKGKKRRGKRKQSVDK